MPTVVTEAQQISVMRLPADQQVQNKDIDRSMLCGYQQSNVQQQMLLSSLAGIIRIRSYSERNWTAWERSCASHSIEKKKHPSVCIHIYICTSSCRGHILATTELSAAMTLQQLQKTEKSGTRWLTGRSCVHPSTGSQINLHHLVIYIIYIQRKKSLYHAFPFLYTLFTKKITILINIVTNQIKLLLIKFT